ncbi:putative ATP-dependent RNA helicase DDX58 [Toxocara canis]|uniref:Putative ATP-dependent RNA helicase DDX58 n=1 Tax=Toxocara canis TaxID=6265 RepID=A0A0B2USY7_TOXCA|nr:putative ATP-dependent RNA helicase DDX58 [Toxocara canis]
MALLGCGELRIATGERITSCIDGENDEIDEITALQSTQGVVYYVGLQTPLSEVMEACGSSDASSFKIDLNFEYFPPTEAQKAIDDVIEALYNEDIMPLRKYQEELAEPAYNGYNTVVCAPTGSGKTVVAASVIRQHLLQGLLSGEKRKVCFFVTNTTFLEQQAELMRNFLRNRWKVIALSGATAGEAPLLLTLSDNDVIVITPQLIVNLLETQNTQDDLMKFSLTMFSLLVFDEAHHANLNHPYNGVVYYVGLQTPLSEVMEACGSSDASSFKIDLNFEYFPPTEAQKAIDDVIEALYNEDIMPLRKYQEELAEPAYNGYNTVVCAPTGSGKTVVAASVIRQHLLQGLLSGEKRKVCFFVTNTTFLEQQAELMRNFLRNRWKVIALSGATAGEAPLLLTLSDNDVIVITPQLIVNLLETQNTQDDLMKFSLTMFSLLVFDEAHHANLNHPYNEILFAYHSMKRTGALPHSERLPQVIGLTASLGVHGAQNEGEARCHIIRMCANLDVQKLSRVRFNTSELLRYSTIAVDESRFVESAHRSTPFYRAVDRLMESFENRFLTALFMGDNMMPTLGDPKNFNPPKERDIQAYQNWFENLLSRSIPVMDIGRQERICIVECLQYIKVFYLTLQLCAHFPCDVAQCFLREELEELGRSASLEIRQIINESRVLEPLAENKCVNALYEILLKEVRSEFVNNPDGRAIVFVRTRDFAFRLRDAMNADDVLRGNNIRSEVMTGINVSAEEGGQNANVQRDKLNQFANGEVKVLCATSVAEEGIDIKKCTLVISYNYTTNEIAHVQRRGRGRAERSRYLLLTHDRKLAKRDEQNIMREKLMNMALDRIDSMPEVWFRQQVDDCIRKINEERIRAKLSRPMEQKAIDTNEVDDCIRKINEERIRAKLSRPMEQKAIDTNEVYDLRCRKCDVLICTSESVATDSKNTHYFCVDPEIWKRVVCCIEFPKQKKAEETPFVGVGSHHCANRSCNEHWGRIVREKKIALPVLRPGAFVLVSPRKQRIAVSEWKQVKEHFSPREIDSHDYVVMSNALQRPNCACRGSNG